LDLSGSGEEHVGSSCKHGKALGLINCREFAG
jgi:hypothetical protein